MFLGHAQMHCRQGSFFVAEEFTIKNACEKALENINKAREKKIAEVAAELWVKVERDRKSLLYRFLKLFGVKDTADDIKTLDELIKNKKLLSKVDGEFHHSVWMTHLDWANLYASNAKDTCERLLAACSVSKQLYVDAEEWAVVDAWRKN